MPASPNTVTVGFSARAGGTMSVRLQPAEGRANREAFLRSLDIRPERLVCAQQVHGTAIAVAGDSHAGRGSVDHASAIEATDGLVTGVPGLAVAVMTADCLPVLLWDGEGRAVGAVHAGWRSTLGGIAGLAVALMRERFQATEIHALLGPCIGPCCYAVGPEFRDHFPGDVHEASGRLYLDLAAANRRQLLAAGVKNAHIDSVGRCTCCLPGEYYSYRREGESAGRMLAVAMLRRGPG